MWGLLVGGMVESTKEYLDGVCVCVFAPVDGCRADRLSLILCESIGKVRVVGFEIALDLGEQRVELNEFLGVHDEVDGGVFHKYS